MKWDPSLIKKAGFELTEEQVNKLVTQSVLNYIEFSHNDNKYVICANQLKDKKPKDWVELVPLGKFGSRDGRGPFQVTDVDYVLNSINRHGMPLPGDYEHKTYNWIMPDATASGWITDLRAGEKYIEGFVTHTPKALEMLANMEYAFLSPVFMVGEEVNEGFYSVDTIVGYGLVNNPALYLPSVLENAFSMHQKSRSVQLPERLNMAVQDKSIQDTSKQDTPNYLEQYQAAVEDIQVLRSENESLKEQVHQLQAKERQDAFETRLKALGSTLTPKVKQSLEAAFKAEKFEMLDGMFSVLEFANTKVLDKAVQESDLLKKLEFESSDNDGYPSLLSYVPQDRLRYKNN